MAKLFPLGTGISRMRGILKIIKENDDKMDLAKLAEESEIDIDSLLPLIEVCEMLGFTHTKDSKIKLTKEGEELNLRNMSKILRNKLEAIDPFKSAVELLSKGELTSDELFESMESKGILFHGEKAINNAMLKGLFVDWALRTKLMRYDPEKDVWSLPK